MVFKPFRTGLRIDETGMIFRCSVDKRQARLWFKKQFLT